MATFKAVVRTPRKDGFYQVYIRVVHNTKPGYIKTDKVVPGNMIDREGNIKDPFVNEYCARMILQYTDRLNRKDCGKWTVRQIIECVTQEDEDICFSDCNERKRLFLSQSNLVCEFAPRSRKRGYPVGVNIVLDWLCLPPAKPKETNPVLKFKRYAARATFPSALIRKCLAADPSKGCYENHLTTGTRIDGEIISLEAIGKYAPWAVDEFRKALSERRNYTSGRFDFRGYDGSLWLTVVDKDDVYYRTGDIAAGFSKEY